MTEFPCPVPPMPPRARQHCRHYRYELGMKGGPRCLLELDLSAPGAAARCMPPEHQYGATCEQRQDWSDEERAASAAWSAHHTERMLLILEQIPHDAMQGGFACPACGAGRVSFSRSWSNKHLQAACTTPLCFQVIQ